MAVWLFAAHGNDATSQIVKTSGIAWLGAQLVPLSLSGIILGLLPWGFVFLPVMLLWKSTHWAMKSAMPEQAREFWFVALATSLGYAGFSTGVAFLCSTANLSADILLTFVHTFVLALVITCGVVIRYAPTSDVLLERFPDYVSQSIRPAARIAFLLFAVGALVTTVALFLHWPEIRSVQTLMAPNGVDSIFLGVLTIGYLPTAAMWTTSYILGPGIHLGGASLVSLTTASPGALPAFPLLAILPSEPFAHPYFVLAVPVALGAMMFLMLPRGHWQAQGPGIVRALSSIVRVQDVVIVTIALAVVGAMTYVGAAMSSGSLGVNLLKFVGPMPTEVATSAVTLCGMGAIAMMLIPRFILVVLFIATGRHRQPHLSV